MLSSSEDDWPALVQNLRRARGKWEQLEKILVREVKDRRTVGRFKVAVVQAVLLFGSETWVLTLLLCGTSTEPICYSVMLYHR